MSHKVKIFSHKRTIFAHTLDPLYKYFFWSLFYDIPPNNIIHLADNIYPSTNSNLLSTELYNYAPLIEHDFHFLWLTASHERSLILNRLTESDTDSVWVIPLWDHFKWKFHFFFVIPLVRIICSINRVLLRDGIFRKVNYGSDEWTFFSH